MRRDANFTHFNSDTLPTLRLSPEISSVLT